MNDVIFEKLPGGFTTVTGGGSRTSIKLSRPWQPPLPLKPEKCPFCTKPQEKIVLHDIPAGWKLLPNLFTPHRRHRLIIPDKCSDAETLQTLGGLTGIRDALEVARLAIATDSAEMGVFVHIGECAGQNLGHMHWHLMEIRVDRPLYPLLPLLPAFFSSQLLIRQQGKFATVAMGARAGECLIIPQDKLQFDRKTLDELAGAIEWIVTLGNEKFRSTQGQPPEFLVSVRVSSMGFIRYADYCPILTMWGTPEYVFAPLEGGPITLPWPHELTAAHLRDG